MSDPLPDKSFGASLADCLDRIRALRAHREGFALCVVALTEGSAYRKAGAIAVISSNHRNGVISGGCLEADLERLARQTMGVGEPRSVVFDTLSDNDLLFGSGSGCRGRTHILMTPDAPPHSTLIDALLEADERGKPLEVALLLEGTAVESSACWVGDTETAIGSGLEEAPRAFSLPAGSHNWPTSGPRGRLVRFSVRPVPRLFVIGAGPEADALLPLANILDWHIVLADHRPHALQRFRLRSEQRLLTRPAAAFARLKDQRIDACLVMTHTAQNDLEALQAVSTLPIPYVGLLGPRARRDSLLESLTALQRAALRGRLHAPAGIRLGGNGPEAVALSIAAELQQEFPHQGECRVAQLERAPDKLPTPSRFPASRIEPDRLRDNHAEPAAR